MKLLFRYGKAALFAALALGTLFVAPTGAREAFLDWTPSPSRNVAGYRVHYGPEPGAYRTVIDVGDWTSCTVEDSAFLEGGTYFFAVLAYDWDGRESGFSNEVQWTFDPTAPPPGDEPPQESADAGGPGTVAPEPEEPAPATPPTEPPAENEPPVSLDPVPAETADGSDPSPDAEIGGEEPSEPSPEDMELREVFLELLRRLFPTIDFKEV